MGAKRAPTEVCIVATPEAMVSPVSGLYETLAAVGGLESPETQRAGGEPFAVKIVAERAGPVRSPSGLSIAPDATIDQVDRTDVVIVPSMAMTEDHSWEVGRHPHLVAWLRRMYEGGATLCSACTGGMLTAETGLLDGQEATAHWITVTPFRRRHPEVRLRPEEALVVSGEDGRLVTSGASTAWHDLLLYLVARYVGPATAQALARFQLVQWHSDGQDAFASFEPPTDHEDAAVLAAQRWIAANYAVAAPVEEMAAVAELAPTTFKRRFKAATEMTPIAYVQQVRVEKAKRRLETSADPVEEIAWAVGYDDPAAFRRLFKRTTRLTPGAYRRRFRLPELEGVQR
ncbi:MAG TPA: helix-turn-helix domain-containing protein [Solirubrobacterales bacterium]|nr:helix-turn-helix domain-containing protein [Solirubrobacterales bacterium]